MHPFLLFGESSATKKFLHKFQKLLRTNTIFLFHFILGSTLDSTFGSTLVSFWFLILFLKFVSYLVSVIHDVS